MPQIKLVLSDMDGTLLPFGAHEVSARTMAGIAALREAGIAFGPSSGRERSDLIRYFHGDELSVATASWSTAGHSPATRWRRWRRPCRSIPA